VALPVGRDALRPLTGPTFSSLINGTLCAEIIAEPMAFRIDYNGRRWAFFSGLCVEMNPTLEDDADLPWTSKEKQRTWSALRCRMIDPDLDSVLAGVADMTGESFPTVRRKALERCVRMQRDLTMRGIKSSAGPAGGGLVMLLAEVDVFLVLWQLSQMARAGLQWRRSNGLTKQDDLAETARLLEGLEKCFRSSLKGAEVISREISAEATRFYANMSIRGMIGTIAWRIYNAFPQRPCQVEGHGGWSTQRELLRSEGVVKSEQILADMLWSETKSSGSASYYEALRSVREQSIEALMAYPPTASMKIEVRREEQV